MVRKCFFIFLFLSVSVIGWNQQSLSIDTLDVKTLTSNYNTIAIGEYVHGSDNINNKKFEITKDIIAKDSSFRIVMEIGMDEAVLFNKSRYDIDSSLSFFYPIYRDSSFKLFLTDLRNANRPLYGFDCQYFISKVFLPEMKGSYEHIRYNDSIINAAMNASKINYKNHLDKNILNDVLKSYESLLIHLDSIMLESVDLSKQLKTCLLNRISVSKSLLNEQYFWDVRDSLMFECFKNLKSSLCENQKFILLGASAHLSACAISQRWGKIKPTGQYLDRASTYFIHISGYKGMVKTIRGKTTSIDLTKNEIYASIEEYYPNGFSIPLSEESKIHQYNIPYYKNTLTKNCGDFYINIGEILPSKTYKQ